MSQSSNLTVKNKHTEKSNNYSSLKSVAWVPVACACMLYGQHAHSAGGCGSVCLPLESLDLDKAHIPENQYRIAFISEYAKFDNFREGSESVTNPGGNSAIITQQTLQVDYGFTQNWTASILIPYIEKKQQTNRFGKRVASGISDVSLFGRYELSSNAARRQGKSTTIGLGIKLPTGSIDEPNTSTLLPPAFQTGSGAYDLIPTASFFRAWGRGAIFGGLVWRIPLEENKRGYKFGQEFAANLGIDYPAPFISKNISLQISTSYLYANNDNDSNRILPARLRDGSKVLNTGGSFLDIVPGIRYKLSDEFTIQARFSIPVYQNWNGNRATNVGQVAPDITYQFTLIYTAI